MEFAYTQEMGGGRDAAAVAVVATQWPLRRRGGGRVLRRPAAIGRTNLPAFSALASNDYSLLAVIASDTAGAMTVLPEGERPEPTGRDHTVVNEAFCPMVGRELGVDVVARQRSEWPGGTSGWSGTTTDANLMTRSASRPGGLLPGPRSTGCAQVPSRGRAVVDELLRAGPASDRFSRPGGDQAPRRRRVELPGRQPRRPRQEFSLLYLPSPISRSRAGGARARL